jgi:cytosine/adenosine deaminase-related metal-dependent hydrolase
MSSSVDALVVAGADVLVEPGDLRPASDLVLAGGVVEAIAPAGTPRPVGAEVLDATGMLAMPGLVNAHTHSPENPLRGLADGSRLEPWLARLTAAGGVYDEDDHYWCALAGAAEMLLCGTTSVIDHLAITAMDPAEVDGAMRAYRDAGMRGGVAPLLVDADCTVDLARALGVAVEGDTLVPRPAPPRPAAELIAYTDEAMRRWHGAEDGRLHVLAGPSGVQWCSDELLTGMSELARRHGTGLQIHLVETRLQDAASRLRFGCSAAEALDRLGVLGPRASLAHCVWLDDADVELVADRGAVVAHNPAANLRLRSGRAPIPALLAAGARVAVGTDGAASSDDQGTWLAMRLAALVHRGPDEWVGAPEALAMATSGGGRALGVAGLGTLVPGGPADVALLDRGAAGLAGAHDLEAALVLSETGAGVRHVVVGGELVVRDGRPTRFDLEEVRAALAEQCARRRGAVAPGLDAVAARVEQVYAALDRRAVAA